MKIGIDARLWNETGVGRYTKNICINLQSIDKKNEYVLFIKKDDSKGIKDVITSKKWKIVETNLKWHSLSEQYKFPKIINKENVDLMHFPYIDVPFFYKGPFVITIHDLIYHHFMSGKASTLPIWLYGFKMLSYKIVINKAARSARRIIAVSNSTKEEIFDHLMVSKRKVEVVYEASDDFDTEKIKKPDIDNYFLYVGNVYPHKNVKNLMKAFKLTLEKKKTKLVFVGKDDYFYDRLKSDLSTYIDEGLVIVKENVDDAELAGLYKYSNALIRPSLMEGFSLPPLEAMSCDSLVLASDIPVHKEILKENVYYFNPNDYVDMSNKMLYVLNQESKEKKKQIEKSKKLVSGFSWEKAARETLEIYESSTS